MRVPVVGALILLGDVGSVPRTDESRPRMSPVKGRPAIRVGKVELLLTALLIVTLAARESPTICIITRYRARNKQINCTKS